VAVRLATFAARVHTAKADRPVAGRAGARRISIPFALTYRRGRIDPDQLAPILSRLSVAGSINSRRHCREDARNKLVEETSLKLLQSPMQLINRLPL
jgi:hypothetical protein